MYDSFDILPILNWHNFLKSNDLSYLLIDRNKKGEYTEKQLQKNYEVLINSLGKRKLINGYYAKFLHSNLIFLLDKKPISEQHANNDFFEYLKILQDYINEIKIADRIFFNAKEAYNFYYNLKGREFALNNRIYDFNFNNFSPKEYHFDLFKDLATIETYLKISINPQTTSVNHYNAIKKQAILNNKNEKQR